MTEPATPAGRAARAARVIVVGSVMFTFISYWRTAAVVLCDLASTVYYIGGIVENAIGPAAPWFILAVMLFSYAVRSVYLESCSLFVRGGVYRVVKEAMGGFLAKLSVSALMFDYILTGPTSGVAAGQYIMGLVLQFIGLISPETYKAWQLDQQGPGEIGETVVRWGSVLFAVAVTLYFLAQNRKGLHESSDKALKIMVATTIMAVLMIGWCLTTLAFRGPAQAVPFAPNLNAKVEYEEIPASQAPDPARYTPQETEVWVRDPAGPDGLRPKLGAGERPVPKENEAVKEIATVTGLRVSMPDDPLGFLRSFPGLSARLRAPGSWLSVIGVIGLLIAFGHSILAMSGEETLAQVYREVESPKMKNFKKAALIVFLYSIVLTAGISFLAVLIIPDEVRMKFYSGNLLSGLARHVVGPPEVRLALETFVVVMGFLILAGAVNTAIIGSNGVLNRVAEDGVMPDWFLRPHPTYGTTSRILYLISGLQIAVILLSMGHVIVLGEAYAFGVVWSFVFKALAMVVLRFKDKTPREFKVPLNVRVRGVELPIGLFLIFLVLFVTAVLNFFTKEVATVGGLTFTGVFLCIFMASEHLHEKRLRAAKHEHLEQFNEKNADRVDSEALGLTKHYRKLVAIRSPQNLYMLEKTLAETDPETTDVVVMTAKLTPEGAESARPPGLDPYDRQLLTAVVDRAERAGKHVCPFIVPTNNPLYAILRAARDLEAQEVVLGASNKYSADEQLEQTMLYWSSLSEAGPVPLTVRILGRDRDVYLDLAGGNRIPKLSDKARSVAELRAAGFGFERVILTHVGTRAASELFQGVLTMLDPQVALTVVPLAEGSADEVLAADLERAQRLGRAITVREPGPGRVEDEILRLAREGEFDLLIAGVVADPLDSAGPVLDGEYLWANAPCAVFLAAPPALPREPEAPPGK